MAGRIPMGNRLPGDVVQVRASPEAFGAGIGRALDQAGDQGMRVGLTMQARMDREAQEAQAAREAADRAKASTALARLREGMADLTDEVNQGVLSGQIGKDAAEQEHRTRAEKLFDSLGAEVPESFRAKVREDFDLTRDRAGNLVRRTVTKRDREDVTAGIRQTLEYSQRLYGKDPKAAEQLAMDTLDKLGGFSSLNPDQITQLRQTWREGTEYTTAYELVSSARQDAGALDAAIKKINTLESLDPQRRAMLIDRAENYKIVLQQRALQEQERRAREAERYLNQARAAFDTFQSIADKGMAIDSQFLDNTLQRVRGTPFEAGVRQLAQQAASTGGLAAQPLARQRAELDALNARAAQQGLSPDLEKRRQAVEKVVRGSEQDVERDALRAYAERGGGVIQPLDVSNLQTFVQQVGQRVQMAQAAEGWAGRPVSPVTADEAATLARSLSALPVEQKANYLAVISQTVGTRQAVALARQMDEKDKALALAMAVGADRTTRGRFTGELILRGQQALKDRQVKDDNTVTTGVRMQIAKEVGDMLSGDARDDVIDAARLIYFGVQAGGDAPNAKQAVRLAMGQDIIERNGKKLPVPVGMDENKFNAALNAAATSQLKSVPGLRVGGMPVTAEQILGALPSVTLKPLSQNRYAIEAGGSALTDARGNVVAIQVPEYVAP